MISNVGAFPRDPMDRRLMAPLQNGVFDPAPRNANPYNDAFLLDFSPGSPPPAPVDTDNDGMPDAWEQSYGLNPSVQDHNGTQLSVPVTGVPGYTNLECYLNQLADQLVRSSRAKADFGADGRTDLLLQASSSALAAVWSFGRIASAAAPGPQAERPAIEAVRVNRAQRVWSRVFMAAEGTPVGCGPGRAGCGLFSRACSYARSSTLPNERLSAT